MSVISFRAADAPVLARVRRIAVPAAPRVVDVGLLVFVLAMLAVMRWNREWATIPYHLIFLSLILVYSFRVWSLLPTAIVMVLVTGATGAFMYVDYRSAVIEQPELAEVALMPSLVVAMVWHSRRCAAAQDALKLMAESQTRMLVRERDFFRDTSHAIRTPVTIARGHLELAHVAIVRPQAREDVDVAMRQLDRMSVLSNRLLALAQLDAGDMPPGLRLQLDVFVREVGANWAADRDRVWTVDAPHEALILADPTWLALAVDALVENAVHFTRDGGRIEIIGHATATTCSISVSDDGPGVRPEDLEHVFERFWHRRPPNGPMGSGLGLAMAVATARASGGDLLVRNNERAGATFELVLPRWHARHTH